MRTLLVFSSMVLLSACGASNEAPDAATADPATVDVAAGVAATPAPAPAPDRKANPVEKTAATAPNETWDCSGGPGSFMLVMSEFESYETGTGQTRAAASYRIRGDNPFTDMRASGSVEVNADGYEFPNGMTLYGSTVDDNFMAFVFPDSGDSIECTRS